MELGIYSFGETRIDPATGRQMGAQARLAELLEEIELADQVGLDVFGLGEHHRPDYAISSPAVVLAAAVSRTRRIRLTSAVTVLSSEDPVRVFQQFSTLDLLSGGRAEIIAGRGSFIESFPLFGQELPDYDSLFAEKLELLLRLREDERITWAGGRHRAPIEDRGVYPRPAQNPLPIWVAVGGTPQSVLRAGTLGLPLALAIIGGDPARFRPFAEWYREAGRRAGHPPGRLRVGINGHGFISASGTAARRTALPPYLEAMNRIGRERGWPPTSPARFEAETLPDGALFVGDPEEVAEKILRQYALFANDRLLLQLTVGPTPHAEVLRAIELFGTRVAPLVRREVGLAGAPAA